MLLKRIICGRKWRDNPTGFIGMFISSAFYYIGIKGHLIRDSLIKDMSLMSH